MVGMAAMEMGGVVTRTLWTWCSRLREDANAISDGVAVL